MTALSAVTIICNSIASCNALKLVCLSKIGHLRLGDPSMISLGIDCTMQRLRWYQFVLVMAEHHIGICVRVTMHQKTLLQYLDDTVRSSCQQRVMLYFLFNILDVVVTHKHLPQLSARINE